VTWRRQGAAHPLTIGLYPFAPDSRLSVDYNQRTNEWSLIIQDVTPQDEGVYHCQVTSKDDQDNMYNVHLYVASTSSSGDTLPQSLLDKIMLHLGTNTSYE